MFYFRMPYYNLFPQNAALSIWVFQLVFYDSIYVILGKRNVREIAVLFCQSIRPSCVIKTPSSQTPAFIIVFAPGFSTSARSLHNCFNNFPHREWSILGRWSSPFGHPLLLHINYRTFSNSCSPFLWSHFSSGPRSGSIPYYAVRFGNVSLQYARHVFCVICIIGVLI